jgi:hypothetical protein
VEEVVAVHAVLVLEVPDHRFDGGAAAHLAFDVRDEAALLPGGVDLELVIGRRVVRSPLMAESATFALKAGVWFRRGRLLIASPDSQGTACPLSGRNSTYRPVQIFAAGSIYRKAGELLQ